MLRIVPTPHFHTPHSILDYIQAFSILFPQKIQFLTYPCSYFASKSPIHTQYRNSEALASSFRCYDQPHLSGLVYRSRNNEVHNWKCRFYTTRTIDRGSRGGGGGGGGGGGRDSMSRARGGEKGGKGGGGNSAMRTRDLSLVGERRKKGGVAMDETGNSWSRESGPVERGFGLSRDDESGEEEDDEWDDYDSVLGCHTETRFDQFSFSPSTMKALRVAGYEKMTVLQEATIPVIQKGKDVLAKAWAGTGRNAAFLLPSIDLVAKPAAASLGRWPPIPVLVVCTTREIAVEVAEEAKKLLKYHASLDVQVLGSHTRFTMEQNKIQANPCKIIVVGTPGRLKDHIETTPGFATRLRGLKVLVLNEADYLSDMEFRKEIEIIIDAIPTQRQTLLFSATIPPGVKQICHIALKEDYEYIDRVQKDSEETHTHVRQTYLVATLDNHFLLLYTLLKEHIANNVDYEVLVYCTTGMVKKLVAELLEDLKVSREILSRKSQCYRTTVSDVFRKSRCLIQLTSDVSACGVNPDATLVVQFGLPADRQQYLNRVSRAGGKDKKGEGVLLLAPFEEFFLSSINDIPITKAPVPLVDPVSKKKVEKAMSRIEVKDRESAYQSWLKYYTFDKDAGNDKCQLVELANEFSRAMMLDHPPAIAREDLVMMGLNYIPGLRSK